MVSGERAQAYTLEGVAAAVVVLLALLIAVQSVVISPSTGGGSDGSVRSQLQVEATDALAVAAAEGELSALVRHWDPEEGYGTDPGDSTKASALAEFDIGALLDERFGGSARSYNLELVFEGPGEDGATERVPLAYRGSPGPEGVVASRMVVLSEDQELTRPGTTRTLGSLTEGDSYPIPNVEETSRLYNVVEVRLTVW